MSCSITKTQLWVIHVIKKILRVARTLYVTNMNYYHANDLEMTTLVEFQSYIMQYFHEELPFYLYQDENILTCHVVHSFLF